MEKRKSDRQHVGTGVLLTCILLFLASVRAEPAEQTAKNSQTIAATPPNETAVALYGTVKGQRQLVIFR